MDMYVMLVVTRLAPECEEHKAKHVKRSEESGEQTDSIERMAARNVERAEQDGVLAEKSSERRDSRYGQRSDEHGRKGVFYFFAQAAHVAHVLFAAHGVN